ncbi:TetR/AcrR family transcriptional regulator [Nesterenkonia haasae]|uniref:TetR/AcrR family transcriptional regulator n=1 Tax=Nesterenkonia haasae TaxID=2587813 RepID=UPI001291215C|nr:TetR family transcriptional regulator C-terminal domain-containing protein [Nesterenkonia haasae]NDK32060.1 TetR family transcriptional regulator [Nesterenkonia haasae]
MPKRVDREERRQEIVCTYLKIAARDGMEAATTRALAAELGVASGALWHYFRGFDEVLHEALKFIFSSTNYRVAERIEGLSGLRALTTMLQEIIPAAEHTQGEAYVVVSFWGRVPSRPDMAGIQSEIVQQWHDDFFNLLKQAVAAQELSSGAPLDVISDTILALCTGFQVEFVLSTPLSAQHRQWRMLHHVLAPWMTDRGVRAADFPDLSPETESALT